MNTDAFDAFPIATNTPLLADVTKYSGYIKNLKLKLSAIILLTATNAFQIKYALNLD